MHFTPTYSSWLNLVERGCSLLTERQPDQTRRSQSTAELEAAIVGYIEHTNDHPKPFVWTKTADEIIASVARFCQRTLSEATSSCLRREGTLEASVVRGYARRMCTER